MLYLKITAILFLAHFLKAEPSTTLVQIQAVILNNFLLKKMYIYKFFKMFRHGVRSILIDYPNDTKKTYWDKYGGYGQVTAVRMKE